MTTRVDSINQFPFNYDLEADGQQSGRRFRQLKRSAWSLPPNTTARFVINYGVAIAPLNQTLTYIGYFLPFNFRLPTYQSMQELYQTLDKLKEYDDDGNDDREDDNFGLNFYEEQRANHERRKIYDHVEEHLNQ